MGEITYRYVRKSGELKCRRTIATTLRKKEADLDEEYQNIGRYLPDYTRTKEELRSIDLEEANAVMIDIRRAQKKKIRWQIAAILNIGR